MITVILLKFECVHFNIRLGVKEFIAQKLVIATSADSDQTAPKEQSDLGLHCLLRYFYSNMRDLFKKSFIRNPSIQIDHLKSHLKSYGSKQLNKLLISSPNKAYTYIETV